LKQSRETKDAAATHIWNIEINEEIMSKNFAKQILDVVDKHKSRCNLVNLVTALHRIAKSSDGYNAVDDPRFQNLIRTIHMLCIDGSAVKDPYALVSTLWSLAKLQLLDLQMIKALSEEVLA